MNSSLPAIAISLLVVGGGVIGMEVASLFSNWVCR
jgi:pyruvate/2-oxoglutarate dehydrogenase complex dihydrolipoamide dehydrogenase (E3) component